MGLPRPTGHVSGLETHSRPLWKSCLWKAGLIWWEGLTARARRGEPHWGAGWAGADLVADLLAALAVLYS